MNKYCRTKASFQKGRSCQSLTNIAFCLTKAAINNASIYEYFSTNLSFLSYKFCQTVNFFSCSCSSFDELLLSTVCDCPTSFVVSFLELSKSPPSTKVEKRTTAKKPTKSTFFYSVEVGFFSSLTRYFKHFVCRWTLLKRLVENCYQRTRLAAVWEFEIRQPVTEVDNCNIAEVLFISQIYNVLLELKYNSEQMLRLIPSSPNCSKPNVELNLR